MASSLLWIIVLHIATLVCSGLAIPNRVEAIQIPEVAGIRQQIEMRPAARPLFPT